jgi:hypothetical protein
MISTHRTRSCTGDVNGLIAEDQLVGEVDQIRARLARLDHEAITRT